MEYMLLRRVLKPESLQILLQRSQNGLVCVLQAARMLLAGVDVMTVHVNDVQIAKGRQAEARQPAAAWE